MKFKIIFISFLLLLGSLSAKAQRGIRVGYIDMEYILENVPEFQEAMVQLDKKAQKWLGELQKEELELEQMRNALKNERILLTKELLEEKEEDISIKETELLEYQQKRFGPQGDLFLQKEQLIKPVQDQVFNAVQQIGSTKKYDFILDSSETTMLYTAGRHDLSDQVLRLIGRESKRRDAKKGAKDKVAEEAGEDEPYMSVEQAENKDAKEAAREQLIQERETEKHRRVRERDSIRAARKAEYDARRAKIIEDRQRKKDSIQKVREERKQK